MTDTPNGRPHVIVHMASSVDGRIQSRRWSRFEMGSAYEDTHVALAGDAWMCGRVTMQGYTRGKPEDDHDPTVVPRTDHIAKHDASGYAVALDARGRLHWGERNAIEGDHVVVVVSDAVSDAHLNALRASGVSYVFGGRDTIDFRRVLTRLRAHFGITRLLVEGGGLINGSLLSAGLVDELSLLLAPTVDGGRGIPAVFDHEGEVAHPKGTALTLTACEVLPDGLVRLRYAIRYSA